MTVPDFDGTDMKQERDHIFISYATEQSALCDWLARRLAAEGYAIWCDRQKLLGAKTGSMTSMCHRRAYFPDGCAVIAGIAKETESAG